MKLLDYLNSHGLKRVFFADKIGVTQQALNNWINKGSRPNLETLLLIEKVTEGKVTLKDWLTPSKE